MSTHSHSSCAACKCLRRKCTPECVFAPHFPPDNPEKFTYVHKVFGASNVGKILRDLPPSQRELAANSLAYEGQARMQDPIYGCVAHISFLHQNLNYVQRQLYEAKKELSTYIGPATLGPFFFAHGPPASNSPYAVPVMGLGIGAQNAAAAHQYAQTFIHEPPPPPPPQIGMAMETADMMTRYDQQQELARFNRGFEQMGGGPLMEFLPPPPPPPPPESMEAQQIGMAMATADMMTRYDQQQELARFNGQRGFEQMGGGPLMEFLPPAPPPPPPPESMEAQQIGMAMATVDMTTRYDQQQELARFNGQRGFEQMEFLPAAQEEFQSDFVQQQQQYYTEPQQPAGRS